MCCCSRTPTNSRQMLTNFRRFTMASTSSGSRCGCLAIGSWATNGQRALTHCPNTAHTTGTEKLLPVARNNADLGRTAASSGGNLANSAGSWGGGHDSLPICLLSHTSPATTIHWLSGGLAHCRLAARLSRRFCLDLCRPSNKPRDTQSGQMLFWLKKKHSVGGSVQLSLI